MFQTKVGFGIICHIIGVITPYYDMTFQTKVGFGIICHFWRE